jgi:hypothetical protein
MFDGVGRRDNSFWRVLFDSDWRQRQDLDALSEQADLLSDHLSSRQDSVEDRVRALERRVAELALVSRALLSLLAEGGAIDRATFDARLRAFDLEDGKRDGR